jgi:hypothetical protein
MTIYDGYQAWKPNKYPNIFAIGDSWFWYPGNNLLESLARHPKLKAPYRHMVRLGQNGALLADYVDIPGREGAFSDQLRALLQRPDPMKHFMAFAISGAGNDSVNYTLGLAKKEVCEDADTPEECISEPGMAELMRVVTQSMSLVMHDVMWAFEQEKRQPVVLLHGYDYAVPDGRGFDLADLTLIGPWLSTAMDSRSVPTDLGFRKGIVKILINRLNDALRRYANPTAGVYFIDSRDTLSSGADYQDDWDNELHPTSSGFDRIVDEKWIPVLQQAGIANN